MLHDSQVALYPLSSPNHNLLLLFPLSLVVALYPLSSPNHNLAGMQTHLLMLRYILFHHQTTTYFNAIFSLKCCVISSFITKPQPCDVNGISMMCCVISSFITKPQLVADLLSLGVCCVISSFITKPQPGVVSSEGRVRCVISSFITKPQLGSVLTNLFTVALYPLSSPNHNLRSPW